jgi:nucleoside-diphosphate-sugar epimerase
LDQLTRDAAARVGKPRRYVVTGCAGFVGSHVIDSLLARGHNAVGVDSFTDYYARERKLANLADASADERFDLVERDLLDPDLDLGALLDEADGVFHLAAQPGVRRSSGAQFARYTTDNVVASERVFGAAAERGRRVVYASSSSVYGDALAFPTAEDVPLRPVSAYGVTKAACEALAGAYARTYGLDAVGLRYFTVYGPRQRPDMAFERILTALFTGSSFTVYGSGDQRRDFTYVHDAVTATLAAMERAPAGAVYNVGGGEESSLAEAIGLCELVVERRLRLDRRGAVSGDVRRTAADTSRIANDLGWKPTISLVDGLAEQAACTGGRLRAVAPAAGAR